MCNGVCNKKEKNKVLQEALDPELVGYFKEEISIGSESRNPLHKHPTYQKVFNEEGDRDATGCQSPAKARATPWMANCLMKPQLALYRHDDYCI